MHCEICLEGTDPESKLPATKWIKSFVHVAQAGSVIGGATDMGLSGPTVSVQITRLEEHLGAKVIERKNPLHLTDLGRALLPTYQRILCMLEVSSGR